MTERPMVKEGNGTATGVPSAHRQPARHNARTAAEMPARRQAHATVQTSSIMPNHLTRPGWRQEQVNGKAP